MTLTFDPAAERARYQAREGFLSWHRALALGLAPGVTFQPETFASVEDQVVETLWAEGMVLESAPAEDVSEARASFSVLSPRRESHGWSVAATLMLAFPDAARNQRLADLHHFPDRLLLELSSGERVVPEVDRGTAGPGDRLPSVLALRYVIPEGAAPAALVSTDPGIPGRWPAPPSWSAWLP